MENQEVTLNPTGKEMLQLRKFLERQLLNAWRVGSSSTDDYRFLLAETLQAIYLRSVDYHLNRIAEALGNSMNSHVVSRKYLSATEASFVEDG